MFEWVFVQHEITILTNFYSIPTTECDISKAVLELLRETSYLVNTLNSGLRNKISYHRPSHGHAAD